MIAFCRKNWFTIGLFVALALACVAPSVGKRLNPQKMSATVAVVLIFFLSGLSLQTEQLLAGLRHWRLHVYIQLCIFIVIPIYFLATSLPLSGQWSEPVQIGILALACLPTTVASCVVLTQTANGNVPAAVFNTVFANMAGILLSPLLLTLLLRGQGESMAAEDMLRILRALALKVLCPFILGQLCHRPLAAWAGRHRKKLTQASAALILLIVYFAFAGAAASPLLRKLLPELPVAAGYVAVSHVVLLLIIYIGARLMRFDPGDRIAIVFTAPQKTLALGIPLLTAYFAENPGVLGPALVPSLIYHPWQLIVAAIMMQMPLVKRTLDRE